MLLPYRINTSPLQSFDFFAIGGFQQSKYSDVAGLELVRSVRRKPTQNDVVCKAILENF